MGCISTRVDSSTGEINLSYGDNVNNNIVKKYILKGEKRIICIQNKFIDLNMVTYIEDNGTNLTISILNGSNLTISMPDPPLSFMGVPDNWRYIDSVSFISSLNLSLEFSVKRLSYNRYTVINSLETQKLCKEYESNWLELKNGLINSWINNEPLVRGIKGISYGAKKMVKEYYELNSGRGSILKDINEIFGFSYGDIVDILGLGEDYIVDFSGELVKIG